MVPASNGTVVPSGRARVDDGSVQVDRLDLLIEPQRDVGVIVGAVEQRSGQVAPLDREDRLPIGRVGLEVGRSVDVVDHAAGHRDGSGPHRVGDAHRLERREAARRQGQVDRSALAAFPPARVGPSLEQVDVVALLGQQHRHGGTGQPAADHGEVSRVLPRCGSGGHGQSLISVSVERSASTACQTSTWVL